MAAGARLGRTRIARPVRVTQRATAVTARPEDAATTIAIHDRGDEDVVHRLGDLKQHHGDRRNDRGGRGAGQRPASRRPRRTSARRAGLRQMRRDEKDGRGPASQRNSASSEREARRAHWRRRARADGGRDEAGRRKRSGRVGPGRLERQRVERLQFAVRKRVGHQPIARGVGAADRPRAPDDPEAARATAAPIATEAASHAGCAISELDVWRARRWPGRRRASQSSCPGPGCAARSAPAARQSRCPARSSLAVISGSMSKRFASSASARATSVRMTL